MPFMVNHILPFNIYLTACDFRFFGNAQAYFVTFSILVSKEIKSFLRLFNSNSFLMKNMFQTIKVVSVESI